MRVMVSLVILMGRDEILAFRQARSGEQDRQRWMQQRQMIENDVI